MSRLILKKGKKICMNKSYRREMSMDKEFERCCKLMAKIMEKYSSKILRDIEREIQYQPERWIENLDEKKSRFTSYVKYFSAYRCRAA